MVYKPNRPYRNKKGRLIFSDGIKKRLKTKQKGKSLAAILGLIAKVTSALFGSGKKVIVTKKQNRYGKRDTPKLVRLPNGRTFYLCDIKEQNVQTYQQT